MKTEIETDAAKIVFFDFGNRSHTETEMESFDARVLLSLVVDLDELDETMRRVRIQVHAMAKENGIALPPPELLLKVKDRERGAARGNSGRSFLSLLTF